MELHMEAQYVDSDSDGVPERDSDEVPESDSESGSDGSSEYEYNSDGFLEYDSDSYYGWDFSERIVQFVGACNSVSCRTAQFHANMLIPSTNPERCLMALPVELLNNIVEFSARCDEHGFHNLHSLSLVCRKLNTIAIPVLYSSGNENFMSLLKANKFADAIRCKPELAKCVKHVHTISDGRGHSGVLEAVLKFATNIQDLTIYDRRLGWAAEGYEQHHWWETLLHDPKYGTGISPEQTFSRLKKFDYTHINPNMTGNFSAIHSGTLSGILRLPALETVTLRGLTEFRDMSWRCPEDGSNVTELLVGNCSFHEVIIIKLLASIKNLTSFTYGYSTFNGAPQTEDIGMDYNRIGLAIRKHKNTLSRLQLAFAVNEDFKSAFDPTTTLFSDQETISLADFPCLEILCIPIDGLCKGSESIDTVLDRLPRQLKELAVRFDHTTKLPAPKVGEIVKCIADNLWYLRMLKMVTVSIDLAFGLEIKPIEGLGLIEPFGQLRAAGIQVRLSRCWTFPVHPPIDGEMIGLHNVIEEVITET